MYFTAQTLDDLLSPVLQRLLRTRQRVLTSRGPTTEMTGVLLRLRNPRARLSHTESKGHVFSPLGELLWYLSGSNKLDFIAYYIRKYVDESEDKKTVYGAYGPRFFAKNGQDQIANVIELLKNGSTTRRAVIQLFDAEDIKQRKVEVPCTCTLQFLLRRRKLYMVTNMRSNDAFMGLPHDVFAFTMLQEIIARTINADVGDYKHAVGSLHLYDRDIAKAKRLLSEGWQTTRKPMPPMPPGDPWASIKLLLRAEGAIRIGREPPRATGALSSYWADLVRLLAIFRNAKNRRFTEITRIKRKMVSPVYNAYIQRREQEKPAKPNREQQLSIPFLTEGDKNVDRGD